MTRVAIITTRASACLAAIELTLSAPRPRDNDGAFANRDQVLTNLRAIKQKASEAEALLRSLDHTHAGIAQARAPAASNSGDAVSNPHPAPFSTELQR